MFMNLFLSNIIWLWLSQDAEAMCEFVWSSLLFKVRVSRKPKHTQSEIFRWVEIGMLTWSVSLMIVMLIWIWLVLKRDCILMNWKRTFYSYLHLNVQTDLFKHGVSTIISSSWSLRLVCVALTGISDCWALSMLRRSVLISFSPKVLFSCTLNGMLSWSGRWSASLRFILVYCYSRKIVCALGILS